MKPIYKAPNEEAALEALLEFDEKWGNKYPYAIKVWQNAWDGVKTMFKYSPEIRHIIYTTNAIEGFNNGIKRITKTKGSFPSDDSLLNFYSLFQGMSLRNGLCQFQTGVQSLTNL